MRSAAVCLITRSPTAIELGFNPGVHEEKHKVAMQCRIIGIIEGEQGRKKKLERNDRVVAIEKENHSFADIQHIKDLGKTFLQELEDFFVNYHELSGEKYRVLGAKGPARAMKRVKDGMRAFKNK